MPRHARWAAQRVGALGTPSSRRHVRGEDIEPLDPVDAAVSAEGAIASDDALPVKEVDEPDAEAGLDNERILLLHDLYDFEMYPEADSGHGPDHENPTKPRPQARQEGKTGE